MLSEDTEEVNFMEKVKQVVEGQEVFRWLSRTDQCDISCIYVFTANDFVVAMIIVRMNI